MHFSMVPPVRHRVHNGIIGGVSRRILTSLLRAAITGLAFWWIFESVDLVALRQTVAAANRFWLLVGMICFLVAQFTCVARWHLLVPQHPALTWPFLANSFWVGSFFNTILPTTVGGDVIRSYDLIKATGQWREPLASVLMDRLLGITGLMLFALTAWIAFPPARQDPVLRTGFIWLWTVILTAFGVLGSRRVLRAALKPFGRIGLGQLESHVKQFQESLLNYRHRPKILLETLGISLGGHAMTIGMFVAVAHALRLVIPVFYLFLIVPIVFTISLVPISLNGWGIREGAMILLLGRIGVGREEALSLSLICAVIPVLSGAIGGILFLARRRRRR